MSDFFDLHGLVGVDLKLNHRQSLVKVVVGLILRFKPKFDCAQ